MLKILGQPRLGFKPGAAGWKGQTKPRALLEHQDGYFVCHLAYLHNLHWSKSMYLSNQMAETHLQFKSLYTDLNFTAGIGCQTINIHYRLVLSC